MDFIGTRVKAGSHCDQLGIYCIRGSGGGGRNRWLQYVLEVDSMGLANGLDVVEWRRTIREVTGFALIY